MQVHNVLYILLCYIIINIIITQPYKFIPRYEIVNDNMQGNWLIDLPGALTPLDL